MTSLLLVYALHVAVSSAYATTVHVGITDTAGEDWSFHFSVNDWCTLTLTQ